MTAPVIRAEGLTKLYRIGLRDRRPETLTGQLLRLATHPVTSFRQLRSLGSVTAEHAGDPDVITALDDVSFEVSAGEVLGVIGVNGAGKSTLLKLLSGVTEPTAGWAEINGRTAGLLEVGTGFHPDLTGRENVYLNGTILGMSRAEVDRNFDRIVAFSGVEKFVDTPVKRYSSGMKVRLAFAVAAHLEPEVLFVDEVLAVGDATFQQRCLDRMSELAASGRTLLFVSHNLGAVRRLCTTGILLGGGSVLAHGPIGNVLAAYSAIANQLTPDDPTFAHDAGIHIGLPTVLPSKTPLTGDTDFVVEAPLSVRGRYWHIAVQIGVNTIEGRTLVLSSVDSEQLPSLLEPGVLRLRVHLPVLWLAPLGYPLRFKVIATPTSGAIERFFSPWVNLDIAGEPGLDAHTDALLAPSVEWEIAPTDTRAEAAEATSSVKVQPDP